MPIALAKFKQAQQPHDARVLAVLGAAKGEALSLHEIIQRAEGYESLQSTLMALMIEEMDGPDKTKNAYLQAVQKLVDSKKIEKAHFQGVDYYAMTP